MEPHGHAAQMIVIQAGQSLIDDLTGRAQVAGDQLGLGERQGRVARRVSSGVNSTMRRSNEARSA